MSTLQEILEKVPQSIKDKFLIKKRERAIEIVKEKISKSGKNLADFDDDEMEGMIADEEQNLKGDQLKTILFSLLTMEGLTYLAEL
jgi:phage terminase Nu1 subunit (DNA packaging protein)